MSLLDLLGQVQAITGGKYGLSDLLSEDFIREKTDFASVEQLLKELPIDVSNVADVQQLSESDLNVFVKEHSCYDTWKELLAEAMHFLDNQQH
ncbi:hypothetical protein [Kurthia huakuii]|uniref:hypothetical protein n=1 Tax=Kurthia huakuii TaxID=1421019 RepID=UPI0004965429|nr:hypothetical protein [Kurthia huakuii]MBM7699260.1 hypothetical protein [Kurthia huakuii]